MRLLLDTCVSGLAAQELEAAGHEVLWAGNWAEDPGDAEILERAHREERVLVTLDKDFGELAVVRGVEHSGILRLVNFPARKQAEVSQSILVLYAEELRAGALITAEPGRVRIRPG